MFVETVMQVAGQSINAFCSRVPVFVETVLEYGAVWCWCMLGKRQIVLVLVC